MLHNKKEREYRYYLSKKNKNEPRIHTSSEESRAARQDAYQAVRAEREMSTRIVRIEAGGNRWER